MSRRALIGVLVVGVAGCASTSSDVTWTAQYPARFERMAKCLAAPSTDGYSVSAEIYRSGGTATISMAQADQPAVFGDYTVQQLAVDRTQVSWRRSVKTAPGQQAIDSVARSRADRCGSAPPPI